jgi:4-hydroxy-tetrahydrodipicolinate reductase
MNIALIGYGKMGKAIEEIAMQRGHSVVLKIDEYNLSDFTKENVSKADVAIEFTSPHSAFDNVKKAIDFQTPVVCGSTGWTDRLDELIKYCQQKDGSFIYASNFSIGVNLFFELNKKLASLMSPHRDYKVRLEEIHHAQKKDAPSGTAITLAEQVMDQLTYKKNWLNDETNDQGQLSVISKRIDSVPGTHSVKYFSGIDDIEITHTAHNRTGFAAGAVLAAEYIKGKKGFFSMKDVLNL